MWGLAITKLDVLSGIDPLKICIAYEIKGRRYDQMPPGRVALARAKPIFEEMPGWMDDLSAARSIDDLPANVRRYLERISALTHIKLAMVGVGASRDAAIVIENPFSA